MLARVYVLDVGSRREDLREENINFEDLRRPTESREEEGVSMFKKIIRSPVGSMIWPVNS